MVEYFTPDGLNKFEGSYSYTDKNGNKGIYQYPQHHGIRIYHVNASLGYFVKSALTETFVCDAFDQDAASKIEGKNVGIDYIYSNTVRDGDFT